MEKNENQLTFIDEQGNEVLCEILFTFNSEEFNKNYVVFVADDASNTVGAASFIENGNQGQLEPITTDEEWELIEDLLEQFVEQMEQQQGGCHCQGECTCGEECECDGECDGEEECTCGCHKNSN